MKPEEKIFARGGDDLLVAAMLSGPGAKNPDHRFTDLDGRRVDADNPRVYGTNFVAKQIDRFSLLDAMEEALGTDTFLDRCREYDARRKGPLELYANLHGNAQWVIKVLLGKDPVTGQEVPRRLATPVDDIIKAMREDLQTRAEAEAPAGSWDRELASLTAEERSALIALAKGLGKPEPVAEMEFPIKKR
jgi:hypothetical protein